MYDQKDQSPLDNKAYDILLNISQKKVFKFLLFLILGFTFINLVVHATSYLPD